MAFSYDLEDTDQVEGADVYNGQQSVLWKLIRLAFGSEMKTMYQSLRSTGAWSYAKFEQAFEEHQNKWPEALFNEDAWYKYLKPLLDPETGESPTSEYLSMLQGSKAEQRKWWLYNRFRYLDSKYNAGDALTDTIVVRGYAKANITVTPYASIYAAVKYGSYLVQQRAVRNQQAELVCPLDNLNDTEIAIYSASQLASVGDLSGLKVGYASFVNGTRLTSIKLGDASQSYSNPNLKTLYLGSNALLQTLDIRNCPNLAGTVDASGCADLEEAYFDGTAITGLTLPNGGLLETLHLPGTVTNLTVRNQRKVEDFTMPSYANLETLWLENVSSEFDVDAIMAAMPDRGRVRLVGFAWEFNSMADAKTGLIDVLDRFRGLDEQGGNTEKAQVINSYIHVPSASGAEIAAFNAKYPYLEIRADHTSTILTYKTYDGSTTIDTETVLDGGNGTKTNSTARESTAQYSYTPNGWSLSPGGASDPDALKTVVADRTVYAAYTATVRTYTVTWKNSNGTTLETDNNVEYGATPAYNGATPVDPSGGGAPFTAWTPAVAPVTGNVTYTASYKPIWTVTFKSQDGATTLQTKNVVDGGTATYTGETPTNADSTTFLGWAASANATAADSSILTNITANKTVYAAHESVVEVAEITDSWDQILAAIDDGTYSTKYKVGNYKALDLGTEGTVEMQIAGIDVDEMSDGTKAPLTFISKDCLATKKFMNPTYSADGGWTDSQMKSYLTSTVKTLIPSTVRSRLVKVKKYSNSYSSGSVVANSLSIEDVWIPSAREAGITGYETSGAAYGTLFTNDASRVKNVGSSASIWWLRSACSSAAFGRVMESGSFSYIAAVNVYGVALGFCLGGGSSS